ncbi:MAG: helix-turn-helix transcriptional regulator, partial [Pseudobutyrivibrio sp.]|nr:helix-turn-helix transcriptional regulator [Pseudobutyrivibrio sp.]
MKKINNAKVVHGKKKIIYNRIADILVQNDINQREFCEMLSREVNHEITQQNYSHWSTGRRNIPSKYLSPIAKLLEVSEPYLLSLTDNPKEEYDTIDLNNPPKATKNKPSLEIEYANLFMYDKLPIYVVFEDIQFESGWALYSKSSSQFIFIDKTINEATMRSMKVHFYTEDI